MSVRCQALHETSKKLWPLAFALLLVASLPDPGQAKVTGHNCSHCHTMHNSQRGILVDGEGPNIHLTVSGCVGCHSNAVNGDTIVEGTPIVWNTTTEPSLPLAGGNFYWVATGTGNDDRGHNVAGISDMDAGLSTAPGVAAWASICSGNSCHKSLAFGTGRPDFAYKMGCQGCHYYVSHHKDNGWYRFLTGHTGAFVTEDPSKMGGWVVGYEDPDWEQNPGPAAHNEYKGTTTQYPIPASYPETNLGAYHTMTAYCVGCHGDFHSQTKSEGLWLRHPSEALIPGTGTEFEAYTTYDPAVPVARTDAETRGAASPVVSPGSDIVMCLSCHRAHASPYPHMLRWEYSASVDQGSTGCRTCHTEK